MVRPRGSSINGTRAEADGARGTHKASSSSKGNLPPLLSPLRLDMDKDERPADSRRRDEADDNYKSHKSKKSEIVASTRTVVEPRLELPPLLSPTLPPEIEAELEKRKKNRSDQSHHDSSESLGDKRHRADDSDEDMEDAPRPKRLIVTLKVPKRLRQSFRSYIQLSKREQARKRPVGGVDEAIASKRPRASDASGKLLPTPSTPSKKGVSMSRVGSANSYADTPGDVVNVTPVTSVTSAPSNDRLSNGQSQVDSHVLADMRMKIERLGKLARQLKHEADKVSRPIQDPRNPNNQTRPSEKSLKLGSVLHAECIISFMAGFTTQMSQASVTGKATGQLNNNWESLFPFMNEKKRASRHYPPLHLLFLNLEMFSITQLLKIYSGHNNLRIKDLDPQFRKYQHIQFKLIDDIREAQQKVKDSKYKLEISYTSTMDEVADRSLKILKRWSHEENVDWAPHTWLKDEGIKGLEVHDKDGKWVING